MPPVSRTFSAYATSYERNYTYKAPHNSRSTGRHITLPSLQVKSSSNFIAMNLHEPKGPHRILNAGDGVGVGETTTSDCIRYHIEKPIVRSPRPQDFHVPLQQFARKKASRSARDAHTATERLLLERKWTTSRPPRRLRRRPHCQQFVRWLPTKRSRSVQTPSRVAL